MKTQIDKGMLTIFDPETVGLRNKKESASFFINQLAHQGQIIALKLVPKYKQAELEVDVTFDEPIVVKEKSFIEEVEDLERSEDDSVVVLKKLGLEVTSGQIYISGHASPGLPTKRYSKLNGSFVSIPNGKYNAQAFITLVSDSLSITIFLVERTGPFQKHTRFGINPITGEKIELIVTRVVPVPSKES